MPKKISIAIFLVMIVSVSAFAQRQQDALLWLKVSLEKKITRKLSFTAEPSIRVNQNVSSVGSMFANLGLAYKLKGPLSFSVNYRGGLSKNKEYQYLPFHRVYVDGNFKEKIANKIRVAIRLRYLQQVTAPHRQENWEDANKTFRVRLKLAPKWDKRTTPYIANEQYYRFNYKVRGWNKMRLTVGAEYEIDKRKSLDFYYIMQRSVSSKLIMLEHVYGMTFNWTI